jgi:hypothetical protein
MITLDFSSANSIQYSLLCINKSVTSWKFYIYQRMAKLDDQNIYSLAWLVSPVKLSTNSYIKFIWSTNNTFVWYGEGILTPEVVFLMGGTQTAILETENQTTFSFNENTPQLSSGIAGIPGNQFLINIDSDVPNNVFSTGIGMSDLGTFVKQCYVNTEQQYVPITQYRVAASSEMQTTQVLPPEDPSTSAAFQFPINVYDLTATIGEDNIWVIT